MAVVLACLALHGYQVHLAECLFSLEVQGDRSLIGLWCPFDMAHEAGQRAHFLPGRYLDSAIAARPPVVDASLVVLQGCFSWTVSLADLERTDRHYRRPRRALEVAQKR